MMYESKLAAAIKVNGKVLREFNKDTVYIPFGSEYSILLKNLNTKRAIVETGGSIEWIGGNLGSGVTMLYPCSVLK